MQIKAWKLRNNIFFLFNISSSIITRIAARYSGDLLHGQQSYYIFPSTVTKACTSISQQRSQRAGNATLAHHANSRNGCMDILLIGNDRLYIVLTKSWAAIVSTHWIIVFNIHICNEFLSKISYYNRIAYKSAFKRSFFHAL